MTSHLLSLPNLFWKEEQISFQMVGNTILRVASPESVPIPFTSLKNRQESWKIFLHTCATLESVALVDAEKLGLR